MKWSMVPVGPSSDGRTNVWRITPPCGHKPFIPQTTMFAYQEVQCPKCGVRAIADYNSLSFEVVED